MPALWMQNMNAEPKTGTVCVRYGCWRTPLKYMEVGESHQTSNGFFTIKIKGYYCPHCGAGYGGQNL
jgi:hypothetical protein